MFNRHRRVDILEPLQRCLDPQAPARCQLGDKRAVLLVEPAQLGYRQIVRLRRNGKKRSVSILNRPSQFPSAPTLRQHSGRLIDTIDVKAVREMKGRCLSEKRENFFRRFQSGILCLPLARVRGIGIDFARTAQQRRSIRPTRENRLAADDHNRVGLKMEAKRTNRALKIG